MTKTGDKPYPVDNLKQAINDDTMDQALLWYLLC